MCGADEAKYALLSQMLAGIRTAVTGIVDKKIRSTCRITEEVCHAIEEVNKMTDIKNLTGMIMIMILTKMFLIMILNRMIMILTMRTRIMSIIRIMIISVRISQSLVRIMIILVQMMT